MYFCLKDKKMATSLDKDVTRETSVLIGDREIQITLTSDQKIFLKLKGLKSGGFDIGIKELYEKLSGEVIKKPSGPIVIQNKEPKSKNKNTMIDLNDLRSLSNTRGFDYDTVVKFDKLISDVLKDLNKE
jgi:hypothetical protein